MSARLAALLVLAVIEVVAGIGLRNEALAARARVQACRLRAERVQAQISELRALTASMTSPEAVLLRFRTELASERAAAEVREPEL